jgi:folate-dependent phosphoribosylglycinamide formyltransferase PurN
VTERPDVVLLAVPGPPTNMVYHALEARFPGVVTVLEPTIPKGELLRRRARRLGVWTAAGQVLFMAGALPLLRRRAARRVQALRHQLGLNEGEIGGRVERVDSVNSAEARQLLRSLDPRVVVVNGTRIISRETLACIDAPFINLHTGITPLYRGVHGGYWALAEGRPDLAGTTVHLVDEGIDTGTVLAQSTFAVTDEDSFATYGYLHLGTGLPLLLDAVRQALDGDLRPRPAAAGLGSRLRSHPTLWQYLRHRLRGGVR